jgi:hypothetical protein
MCRCNCDCDCESKKSSYEQDSENASDFLNWILIPFLFVILLLSNFQDNQQNNPQKEQKRSDSYQIVNPQKS